MCLVSGQMLKWNEFKTTTHQPCSCSGAEVPDRVGRTALFGLWSLVSDPHVYVIRDAFDLTHKLYCVQNIFDVASSSYSDVAHYVISIDLNRKRWPDVALHADRYP